MSKPETRVRVMEYKTVVSGYQPDEANPIYRHDTAAFDYGYAGGDDPNFKAAPTVAKISNMDDFRTNGAIYTKGELLAHIANLQAIADTLEAEQGKQS
jgi:hypothetical protein